MRREIYSPLLTDAELRSVVCPECASQVGAPCTGTGTVNGGQSYHFRRLTVAADKRRNGGSMT